MERAGSGRGRLVLVTGEAGAGKTRLCEELIDRAGAAGFEVGWASCWESAGLGPLWPWSRVLAGLGIGLPEAVAAAGTAEVVRARRLARLADDLAAVAGRRPCVLVLDDLQWADPSSVLVLSHLAPILPAMAILVVGTARTAASAVPAPLRRLARRAEVVDLDGLPARELAELAASVGGGPVDPAVGGWLRAMTGGNPLLARELVRVLAKQGRLGDLRDEADPVVPPTIRAVLGERLAELSATARDVVSAAAVVGQAASVPFLARVTGLEPGVVLGAVDEAVGLGVLATTGVGQFSLVHPLLRSVAYDGLPVAAQVVWHGRVARALVASRDAGQPVDAGALSFHFFHAAPGGSIGEAVRFSAEAAEAAMAAGAPEEAVALYDRALSAAALDPPAVERAPLLVGSGRARLAAGNGSGARAHLRSAAELARGRGDAGLLAEAALALAGPGFEVPLFDGEQIALLEEALACADAIEPSLGALLAARLSVALSLADQDDRRRALADGAVDEAAALGDPGVLTHALAARCDVRAGPADVDGRTEDADRVVRLARRVGDPAAELLGLRLGVVAAMERGDLAGAARRTGTFAGVAARIGPARFGWYAPLWRAALAAARGAQDEWRRASAEAEELGRRSGSPNWAILVATQRWFALLELGAVDEAVAGLEASVEVGRVGGLDPREVPYVARHRLETDRPDDARALLDGYAGELRAMPRDSEWLTTAAQFAELAARLGGHRLAPWLYDALAPYGELWAVEGIGAYTHGPVHRHLGLLAALMERAAEARAHFDRAAAAVLGQGCARL